MSDPVMILVHPGSMYGSASALLGPEAAQRGREDVLYEIETWQGGLIVIDGALSDEISRADQDLIEESLDRAAARGAIALRIWGDDGGLPPYPGWSGRGEMVPVHPDQMEAAKYLAPHLEGSPRLEVIGCWASPQFEGGGCVNSVAQELRAAIGSSARVEINPVSMMDPDLSEDDPESWTDTPEM